MMFALNRKYEKKADVIHFNWNKLQNTQFFTTQLWLKQEESWMQKLYIIYIYIEIKIRNNMHLTVCIFCKHKLISYKNSKW